MQGQVSTSAIATQQSNRADNATDKIAAENGLLGYDHQKQIQKKLLEFVSPVYKGPLIEASLIKDLSIIKQDSTALQREAADTIASSTASSAVLEQQARMMEQVVKNQVLESSGLRTPGSRSLGATLAMNLKASSLEARVQLLQAQLDTKREQIRIAAESKAVSAAAKIALVKSLDINPITSLSGAPQNTLLKSMKENVLRYDLNPSDHSEVSEKLKSITMTNEEFERIQLKLEVSGTPVSFSATKGLKDLGAVPLTMRHPRITPLLNRIQDRFDKWSAESPPDDLYAATQELSRWLDELEQVSDEVIGTARDAARQGSHQYSLWTLAKDYRTGLRGLLQRIELEGDTSILRVSRSRFDPSQHQNSTLEFARFIVLNGCKIEPGLPGGEGAYTLLHRQLLELNTFFGD